MISSFIKIYYLLIYFIFDLFIISLIYLFINVSRVFSTFLCSAKIKIFQCPIKPKNEINFYRNRLRNNDDDEISTDTSKSDNNNNKFKLSSEFASKNMNESIKDSVSKNNKFRLLIVGGPSAIEITEVQL